MTITSVGVKMHHTFNDDSPGHLMRIAIAQKNVKLGDIAAIDAAVDACVRAAQQKNIDLLVFPELFLIGGPAGLFAARKEVLANCEARLCTLAQKYADGPAILIGTPEASTAAHGKRAYNSAALLHQGESRIVHRQICVADFGVKRDGAVFEPGYHIEPLTLHGRTIGVAIGNDLWNESDIWRTPALPHAPAERILQQSDLLIHLDADPWYPERPQERLLHTQTLARADARMIISANTVGTAQSLLYDGRSMVVGGDGTLHSFAPQFEDALHIVDLTEDSLQSETHDLSASLSDDIVDETLDALIFGLRDNVRKSGFHAVTLGLSGGIDSAIVAAIAVEALGAEHVYGVALPSRYSSDHSLKDARDLAEALKIPYDEISIEAVHHALLQTLAPSFEGTEEGTAEENLQARARGVILMGLSNKFDRLLLATSNKSEFAVGYSTLYGDMSGAFSPLTDVPKEMVYAISRRFNERRGFDAIPQSTLTKPPSAELRPGQRDQDSLPSYEVLDEIVDRYLVRAQSAQEIVEAGFAKEDVRRVVWLMDINGYKRQQAAPGLRVSRQALAIGRDFPSVGDFSALNLP